MSTRDSYDVSTVNDPVGYDESIQSVRYKPNNMTGNKVSQGQDPDTIGYNKGTADVENTSKNSPNADDDSEKKDESAQLVSAGEMFRFADRTDKFLMALGTLMGLVNGAAMPLMFVVFGNMTNIFINNAVYQQYIDMYWPNISSAYPNVTQQELYDNPQLVVNYLISINQTQYADQVESEVGQSLQENMQVYSVYYAILGGVVLVVAYLQMACWQIASYNQCLRIRQRLFHSILRQDISWFDTHESGELNTRLTDDINQIELGIGDKLAMFFQYFATFLAGIIIGFVYGWQLTLVILSVSPLLALSGGVMARLGAKMTALELKAYAKAGAVAEEVLGSLRTVVAFGGQGKESIRYEQNLTDAKDLGIRKALINGCTMGFIFFLIFGTYGLAFWYGTHLIVNQVANYTAGSVIVVFFCVLIGAFSLGNAAPNIQDFSVARGAAYAIYGIIDLQPAIDSYSDEGKMLTTVVGNLKFKDVWFSYPSRPDTAVLNGLNVNVDVGQTVALVGPSGCGKSTTVQLIQRFYDPQRGSLYLDGVDIREFNIKWLRQQIGVVSQEPVLFGTTIGENIRYGKEGVTKDDIQKAAKEANAHDFIMKFPKKYETLVGERGAQMSGGQKQRIAIARALVRDPKILLLDEATSALDAESEATVQAALDKARRGRTTIIVAHRLSTIRTADKIAGFDRGVLAEQGTHEELMKHRGIYYTLVTNQSTEDGKEDVEAIYKLRSFSLGSTTSDIVLSTKRTQLVSESSNPGDQVKGKQLDKTEDGEDSTPPPELKRILRMNAPEAPFIIAGCIGSVVSGVIQPAIAVVFALLLGSYSDLNSEQLQEKANFYAGMFAVIGVVSGIAMFLQSYCFARSGEPLTMRVRKLAFDAYLRQDISYFDDPKNNTGAMCARLATDASAVKGATGARFGAVIQAFSTILAGLTIGFVYSWQLTLLILAFAPFIMLAGAIRVKRITGRQTRKTTEAAGKLAIDAIENMRTVATLTKEEKFCNDFNEIVAVPYVSNKKQAHIQGLAYSVSQACMFFAYAACFTLGAYLVQYKGLPYENMFMVFSAIVFSAMAVGQAMSFAPDYGKAKLSAGKVFELLDRPIEIDSFSDDGEKVDPMNGSASLDSVHFTYPNRPEAQVLKGISINVGAGQVIALVGSSGCGKSTIVQLLERFYDPSEGTVNIQGRNLKSLNLGCTRSQMGIVSQEPVLFDCSIRENIAYGDNCRDVSMAEITEAAKQANIHNFIASLPEGYDTNVGDKGTQLSGGQKQRVAIARALIRNPKILLLDEATSALDTESEKIVQEALDRAQKGRTSIVIAHRLSTIQNADCIVVIKNGVIVETGKHSDLLARKGVYYELNKAQINHSSAD